MVHYRLTVLDNRGATEGLFLSFITKCNTDTVLEAFAQTFH